MQATILLNNKGFEKNGSKTGELITSKFQHTLYYDAGLGLFYRNNKSKVETLATKVDGNGIDKIRKEIVKLREKAQTVATFTLNIRLRE